MSASVGTLTNSWMSLTAFLQDREIAPQILDLQNDGMWTSMLAELGYTNYIESKEWFFDSFYNDPKLVVVDTTGASISTSGTSGNYTLTITGLTAGNNNYIKVGDTLLLPNGKSPLVTAVTTNSLTKDTVTCKTDVGTLTLTAGDKIIVNGNALEEGSNATDPMRFTLSKYRNLIQIFDEGWKITDVEAGAKRTVAFNGNYYQTAQSAIDSLQHLQAKLAMTWWSGEVSSTQFDDASPILTGPNNSYAVQKTRGMNQAITSYGITPSTTISGVVGTPDMQDVCDRLTGVKAPADYWMFGGNSPKTVIDIWAKNLNSSGATSVRIDGTSKDVSFGASAIEFGGFNFKLMALPILSNPQTFNFKASGSTTHAIGRSIFLLPSGNCPVYGGTPKKYFAMRFAQVDPSIVKDGLKLANSNYISEFTTGAFAGVGLDANFQSRYYTNMGVEANLPQLYGRWLVK